MELAPRIDFLEISPFIVDDLIHKLKDCVVVRLNNLVDEGLIQRLLLNSLKTASQKRLSINIKLASTLAIQRHKLTDGI